VVHIQADFSKCLVKQQGPILMGLTYIAYLAKRSPVKAARKAFKMGLRYLEHHVRALRGEEDLSRVFELYEGMPVYLLDRAARMLKLNGRFIDEVRKHREEHGLEQCVVDIYTRDASGLVHAFLSTCRQELEEAGIIPGAVFANELHQQEGVFTGDSTVLVTLDSKERLLSSAVPYFASSEEGRYLSGSSLDLRLL